ncbi:hypothetical protein ACS0TY_017851 [Phlomoides rotata]
MPFGNVNWMPGIYNREIRHGLMIIIEYALTYTLGFFAPLADVEDWGEPNFQLRHNPAHRIRRRGRDVTTRIYNEMDWAQTRARQQYQT